MDNRELSDRFEIQDLLVAYTHAIDQKDFDALDDIFTNDAIIDYTEAGGAKGNLSEIKAYLARALEKFPSMQHMLGLPQINIIGDKATARTLCFNPMVTEIEGERNVFFVGLWYDDELRRTEQGWRISSRKEDVSYFHNLPASFQAVNP